MLIPTRYVQMPRTETIPLISERHPNDSSILRFVPIHGMMVNLIEKIHEKKIVARNLNKKPPNSKRSRKAEKIHRAANEIRTRDP